ncbi:uncharacterized protein LOC110859826 isoform X2 [Folsomia candida]|uniref:uncharacterized protein LOC110859826 isoform X2 n=1 Tax=Folsomia candida TaxID=158441 RepID=UPI00160500BE|nr:uncharacterized protein LOC110859826 isoform X2 [Folsomia candida]
MEISSCWDMSQRIHPLLVNHIVERILERHAEQDPSLLLSLRQVCHVWNQVASRSYRKHATKHITFGKNFHRIADSDGVLDHIKNSELDFPLGNFTICPEVFQAENKGHIETFLSGDCSLFLTSLVIRLDSRSTLCLQEFTDIQLPRLKKFIFDDRRPTPFAFDTIFPVILKSAGNSLESLSIHRKQVELGYRRDIDEEDEMMARICDALESVNLRNVQNLQIELVMSENFLSCLTSRFHSLRELSLCLKKADFGGNSLHNLLQRQENTLEKLRLVGLCKNSLFQIDLPRLRNLRVIEIHGWCHNIPQVEFSPFSISHNFPNLTDLVLDTWSSDPSWCKFLQSDDKNSTLTRIKLPQELFDAQLVAHISTSFINLKVLTLHFQPSSLFECSAMFEKVFETLGESLEELVILESFCEFGSLTCIDSLLTGLSVEECGRMLRVNNYSGVIESDNVARRPSLLNLKSLKCLDLSDVLKRQVVITDVTGYMLLHMSGLDHLRISRSKIRQNCFYQLHNKFPLDLCAEMNSNQHCKQDQHPLLENENNNGGKYGLGNCLVM